METQPANEPAKNVSGLIKLTIGTNTFHLDYYRVLKAMLQSESVVKRMDEVFKNEKRCFCGHNEIYHEEEKCKMQNCNCSGLKLDSTLTGIYEPSLSEFLAFINTDMIAKHYWALRLNDLLAEQEADMNLKKLVLIRGKQLDEVRKKNKLPALDEQFPEVFQLEEFLDSELAVYEERKKNLEKNEDEKK